MHACMAYNVPRVQLRNAVSMSASVVFSGLRRTGDCALFTRMSTVPNAVTVACAHPVTVHASQPGTLVNKLKTLYDS
jgi:hypothetical protein